MSTLPQLVSLSSWSKSESFENLNLPSKLWKIPTAEERDITHAIFMSYLFSCDWNEFNEELLERLKCLFVLKKQKEQNVNVKNLKKHVKKYNPFRNSKKPMFNNDISQRTSNIFQEKLNYFLKAKSELKDVLNAASKLLKCSLVLFYTDEDECKKLLIVEDKLLSAEFPRKLHIFCDYSKTIEDNMNCNIFAFGMTEEHAYYHRRYALDHILRTAEIDNDQIEQMKNEISCYDNFLIHTLKMYNSFEIAYESSSNNFYEYLLKKFLSFPHIAKKLGDAGFNMNPLKTDENGLSAFYYSLTNTTLLKLLYNYVSNNFHQSDCSIRRPAIIILESLKKIKEALANDYKISNNFSELLSEKDIALRIYPQIMRFNEYQIDTVQLLVDVEIMGRNNLVKKKEIIISILNSYCRYFDRKDCRNSFEKFQDYVLFNDYYEFLDNFFCLLFFDHFFSLYPLVNDNNKRLFTSTTSSLFLAIFSRKLISIDKYNSFNLDEKDFDSNIHYITPFCYREKFFGNAIELKEELKRQSGEIENTEECRNTMKIIKESLVEYPEILEEFTTQKISTCLETVVEFSSETLSQENMFITGRSIQILGEIVQNDTMTNCLTRHFLCSILTGGLEHQVCQLRDHCFSKYRSNSIVGLLNFERRYLSFEAVRNEFEYIINNFQYVCVRHELMTLIMMLDETADSLSQRSDSFEFIREKLSKTIQFYKQHKKDEFVSNTTDFKVLLRNMMNYVVKTLKDFELIPNAFQFERQVKKFNGGLKALLNLLNDLHSYGENNSFRILNDYAQSLSKTIFLNENVSDVSVQDRDNRLNLLNNFFKSIAKELGCSFDQDESDFQFETLNSLLSSLKNFNNFNEKQKLMIQEKMEEYHVHSIAAKKFCIDFMETESDDVLNEKLSIIIMKEKDRKYVRKNMKTDKSIAIKFLQEIDDSKFSKFYAKESNITLSLLEMKTKTEFREVLSKLKFTHKLNRNIFVTMNQKMVFLINRIDNLEKLLIKNDNHIEYLWNRGKGENVRKYVKQLICNRYIQNRRLRVAVEKLIFDCFNILDRNELKILWEKNSDLFSGINLREYLAHGSPVLEIVGLILDDTDMPATLIEAASKLIDDRRALSAISKLWYRLKFDKYRDIIKDIEDGISEKESGLRDVIRACTRWKHYVSLLPIEM